MFIRLIFFSLLTRLLLLTNGGAPEGSGGNAGGGNSGNNTGSGSGNGSGNNDIIQSLQNLIGRNNGDTGAVATLLFNENYQLRDRVRQLEGRVPAEGSMVLTGDQVTAWQAYQQIGDVATVQQRLTDGQTAISERDTLRRDGVLRDVAEMSGFRLSVLQGIRGATDLQYEVREVDENGQRVRRAFVRNGETTTPVADYANQHWADFLPALRVAQQGHGGVPFPAQNAGSGAAGTDLVAQALQRQQAARDAAPNPLKPQ